MRIFKFLCLAILAKLSLEFTESIIEHEKFLYALDIHFLYLIAGMVLFACYEVIFRESKNADK